jgi:hypothetical protein
MDSTSSTSVRPDPPIYKQALVGLMVGATLGPLVGWFIGTFAMLFVGMTSDDLQNTTRTGMRMSAFAGGLLGIPFGLIVGPLVGLPLRLMYSTVAKFLTDYRLGAAFGALFGMLVGYIIHWFWHPSSDAFTYIMIHSVFVGACVGILTVTAQPKWL